MEKIENIEDINESCSEDFYADGTMFENNRVFLVGTVIGEPEFSHMIYGEKFYLFKLKTERLSESCDIINITVSERFFSEIRPEIGDVVKIQGQFRSYNNFSSVGNRLILTVFVKEIERIYDLDSIKNPNRIFLNGFICKPPIYRTTPFKREIADVLLAVNRSYNKSDYIPCIAWGRNAKFAATLDVGTNLRVWGRIQSREYRKKIGDEEFETKTAYEISVSKLEAVEEE